MIVGLNDLHVKIFRRIVNAALQRNCVRLNMRFRGPRFQKLRRDGIRYEFGWVSDLGPSAETAWIETISRNIRPKRAAGGVL